MEFSQMSRAEQLAQLQELRTEYEKQKAKQVNRNRLRENKQVVDKKQESEGRREKAEGD